MISDFHFYFFFQIIPGSESRSVEAVCWQGSRLFSAGLDGNVTEYDLKKLKPKVCCFAYTIFLNYP